MSTPRKEVSLRGASAKEITRDALLQKVSHERELRSFTRRAAAAALFIQRVWRRYIVMKKVAEQLQEEWKALAYCTNSKNNRWISRNLIRPFLFFTVQSSNLHQRLHSTNVECMLTCFKILLQSISSSDMEENFCSLATGNHEDKSIWLYQTQKLVSLCSLILCKCDLTCLSCEKIVPLTALATRLLITLTDTKGWMGYENVRDADIATKKLMRSMVTMKPSIYFCLRGFFMKLGLYDPSQKKINASLDDSLLITASAITLALRPFQLKKLDANVAVQFDVEDATKQYFSFILSVPYLTKRLPPLLLPALKHESALLPCLTILLISKDKIFSEMLKLDQSELSCSTIQIVPSCGWALANIINLTTKYNSDSSDSGHFVQGLTPQLYVQVANCISENFLNLLENDGRLIRKDNDQYLEKDIPSSQTFGSTNCNKLKSLYIDLLKPVHQQWHFRMLLEMTQKSIPVQEADTHTANQNLDSLENLSY